MRWLGFPALRRSCSLFWLGILDLDVRLSVAGNSFASNSVLIELSQAIDDEVREAVARNPSAPVEVLRHLIDDQVLSIRRFIALHCRLPADLSKRSVGMSTSVSACTS